MSFLASMAGNLAGDFLGGMVNNYWSKKLQENQAKLQRQNWEYAQKNQYQFSRQDLEAANLNPALMYSSGAQMSSMGGAPSATMTASTGAGSKAIEQMNAKTMAKATEKSANAQQIKAEADKLNSLTNAKNVDNMSELIKKQAENFQALTQRYRELLPLDTAETQSRIHKNLAEVEQKWSSIELQYKDIDSLMRLREKQGYLTEAQAGQAVALIGKISAETTGQHINNGILYRELTDPDKKIHIDYRNSKFGTYSGYVGELLNDVSRVGRIFGR